MLSLRELTLNTLDIRRAGFALAAGSAQAQVYAREPAVAT